MKKSVEERLEMLEIDMLGFRSLVRNLGSRVIELEDKQRIPSIPASSNETLLRDELHTAIQQTRYHENAATQMRKLAFELAGTVDKLRIQLVKAGLTPEC